MIWIVALAIFWLAPLVIERMYRKRGGGRPGPWILRDD